jgi:soluble lytic murein transglycosylase-like protein
MTNRKTEMTIRRLLPILLLPLLLMACATPRDASGDAAPAAAPVALYPGETPRMRGLIRKWAAYYDMPESLLHRVIQRESDYRPRARSGPYWGLMQILPATARNMGMRGDPAQLLEADTALRYSTRYLRGAWMVADGDEHEAMMWYARGYYFEAKRRGLLRETGLRGNLWQRYDRGEAEMPAIGPKGRLLPPEPACTPRTGFAAALRGSGCPES